MAFGIQFTNNTDKKLIKNLQTLGRRTAKKVLRQAVSAATRPIAKTAKKLAPKGPESTGQLKKSIGMKIKAYANGNVVGVVGPREGFKISVTTKGGKSKNVDPDKYAHLVERGHRIVRGGKLSKLKGGRGGILSKGKVVGYRTARPFLVPAIERNRRTSEGIMRKKLASGIEREFKKGR